MRAAIAVVVFACLSSGAVADQTVRGYVRKDGTYVAPHMRSSPNQHRFDNYSSSGNSKSIHGATRLRSQRVHRSASVQQTRTPPPSSVVPEWQHLRRPLSATQDSLSEIFTGQGRSVVPPRNARTSAARCD